MAPSILFMDELEKELAGINGSGDSEVCFIGTANGSRRHATMPL